MKPLKDEQHQAVYVWRDGFHLADKMDAQACGETVDRMRSVFPNPRKLNDAIAHDARRKADHPFRPALTLDAEEAQKKLNRIEINDTREQLRIAELVEGAQKMRPSTPAEARVHDLMERIASEGITGKAHRTIGGKVVRMDEILSDDVQRAALLDRMQSMLSQFRLALANFRELEDLIEPVEELKNRVAKHQTAESSARQ